MTEQSDRLLTSAEGLELPGRCSNCEGEHDRADCPEPPGLRAQVAAALHAPNPTHEGDRR